MDQVPRTWPLAIPRASAHGASRPGRAPNIFGVPVRDEAGPSKLGARRPGDAPPAKVGGIKAYAHDGPTMGPAASSGGVAAAVDSQPGGRLMDRQVRAADEGDRLT